MRKVDTYGKVTDGVLKIHHRQKFTEAIRHLDGRVIVTVEKVYRKRSSEQNQYYWGVIVNEFCEGYHDMTGEFITKDEAHELLKHKCNGKEVVSQHGEVMTVGQSTAQMTTVQMSEYWDRCRQFIEDWFNRRVPEPNEQMEIW